MNQFITGFDDHDTAGLAHEWITGTSPTVVTGLTGNCVYLEGNDTITKPVSPSATKTVGFRIKFTAFQGQLFLLLSESVRPHVVLIMGTDGKLQVARSSDSGIRVTAAWTSLGTGSTVLLPNTEYYIEIQATIAEAGGAGRVAVRLNGASENEITVETGADTQNQGSADIRQVSFIGSVMSTFYVDDIYINDPTGTDCNDFMGDVIVHSHFPVADGAESGWTPSEGTDRYAVIDENTPNTTDYIQTITPEAINTVGVEDFKNNGADILAMQTVLHCQKSDAGTCSLATVIREGGVNAVGTTKYPSTSWVSLSENYSLPEGDAKRNASGFNALEFGVKRVV